jgi:hypothetical protein
MNRQRIPLTYRRSIEDERHGELEKKFIDSNINSFESDYDAKRYLPGIRYLTERETTYIFERLQERIAGEIFF